MTRRLKWSLGWILVVQAPLLLAAGYWGDWRHTLAVLLFTNGVRIFVIEEVFR